MRKGQEDLTRTLETLQQTLSQVNSRLIELENRLSRVETGQILMDEQQDPAEIGQLGGKTLSTSTTGTVRRNVRIPFCDVCGKRVEEDDLTLCYSCGRKVCSEKCLVKFDAFLCVECLKEKLPLSKKDFKILVGVTNDLVKVSEIEKVTKVPKDDVGVAVSNLIDLGLITKKGISIASKLEVTDEGLEALSAYRSVYGTDEDVVRLLNELEKISSGL